MATEYTFEETEGVQICNTFGEMGLKSKLLQGIYNYGFEDPSPIQAKTIMTIVNGHEVIAQAQSGTGKTGAFVISVLQIIDETVNKCQGIIVSPTQELAKQTFHVFSELGKFMNVKPYLAIGGVRMDNIAREELKNCQVLIGTPGRIMDILNREYICRQDPRIMILDEADDLLKTEFQDPSRNQKIGFQDQICQIIKSLKNKKLQICLFSATYNLDILNTTNKFMKDPIRILVQKENLTLDGIKQFHIKLDNDFQKLDTLFDLYSTISLAQTIIYVNTKERADSLYDKLTNNNFLSAVIHSDLDKATRSKIMAEFKEAKYRVLLSTDLLARGIDIQQVHAVINYDIPHSIENYLHRIGRSGRYGRRGVAINFVVQRDVPRLKAIEDYYGITIEEMPSNFADYF